MQQNAKYNILKLIFLALLFFSKSVIAANEMAITDLIQQSRLKNLSEHPYWHALVHYEPSLLNFGRVRSAISTDAFFLSTDGKTNPQNELEETIRSLFSNTSEKPDDHPQCRFVSRYQWLKKQLNWSDKKIVDQPCPGYKLWSFNNHVESISLLFATGYLGSPASFFGHPLLKFNLPRDKNPSDLLDTSLNYGALTPPNENPFVYAAKGLFGGYSAGLTHIHFFYNNHNYSETELRDMWEYELNFNSEQIEQIVSHTWELIGNKFSYLFLSDNCASRMAQLLEAVIDQPLLPRNVPYAIPYTVFDSLAYGKYPDGQPLVKKVSLIPSRQNRFNTKYFSLTKSEMNLVDLYIKDSSLLKQSNYQQLPAENKIKVIETLFDYYAFRIVKEEKNLELKQIKKDLLIERLSLPAKENDWKLPSSKAPHLGQRPVLTRISVINSNKFGSGLELRVRPAYYDFLSSDIGRLPYSALGIFDLSLKLLDQQLYISEFNFISIDTLNPSITGLPGDGGLAWKFKVGAENQDHSCTACTVARIDSGIGKSVQLNETFLLYAMVEGRIQSSIQGSGTLAVMPTLSALVKFSDFWSSILNIGSRYYLDGLKSKDDIINWENRFGSHRNWDLRIAYQYHKDHQTKFSYSYYW